jgi:ABC-type hemin transport system ATPase subunit
VFDSKFSAVVTAEKGVIVKVNESVAANLHTIDDRFAEQARDKRSWTSAQLAATAASAPSAPRPAPVLDLTAKRDQIKSDIARLEKVAVLVATHNMELTHHMDRVLALQDGKLVPFTPPAPGST